MHRDEVRDEVDGRERVGGDRECHRLGVPRHARIARRQVERMHVALDAACPVAQSLQHASKRPPPGRDGCTAGRMLSTDPAVDLPAALSGCLYPTALGMNFKATPFMQ